MIPMSYRHFLFYHQHLVVNNTGHCRQIKSLRLSNVKPFDHVVRFLPFIELYTNLKELHLTSPNAEQLNILPIRTPDLCELYITLENAKSMNIRWLSSLKKLQRCSIEGKHFYLLFVSTNRPLLQLKDTELRSIVQSGRSPL